MASSHLKLHGMSFGLPEVEPEVWKMKTVSSPVSDEGMAGNGSFVMSETRRSAIVRVGSGHPDAARSGA